VERIPGARAEARRVASILRPPASFRNVPRLLGTEENPAEEADHVLWSGVPARVRGRRSRDGFGEEGEQRKGESGGARLAATGGGRSSVRSGWRGPVGPKGSGQPIKT